MGKAKRVRFSDNETDEFPNNGPNTSSGGGEAAPPQVFDAPKTSEYAFFKKIKKDAGRSYCRAYPQEDNQLKSGKSCIRKSVGTPSVSNSLKLRVPRTDISLLDESMGTAGRNTFVSPPVAVERRAFVSPLEDKIDKVKQRSSQSRLSGNIAPFDQNVFFSPIASGSVNSGSQYFGKGVFAGKRQKLHQLAADTLLPEIGQSDVKGLDLVPILLGRLFPKNNENYVKELVDGQTHADDQLSLSPLSYLSNEKHRQTHGGDRLPPRPMSYVSKEKHRQTHAGDRLPPSPMSYVSKEKHRQTHSGDRLPPSPMSYVPKEKHRQTHADDRLPPSPMSYVSKEKLNLIHWKRSGEVKNESPWSHLTPRYSSSNTRTILSSEANHPLANYEAIEIVQDDLADYNYLSDPKVSSSWCRQNDSSLCLPYEKYGHSDSYRIQELSEDYFPSEASRDEPHNLLLEWDFNRHKEKPDFYRAPGREDDMYSMLSTLRDYHNQQTMDVKLGESPVPVLSFTPQYSFKYDLFPHFHATNFHILDIRRRGLEYDSPMDLGPNRPLSRLSCTPKHLTQAEDFDTSNVFGSGRAIYSGQDHRSCLDIDLGWKCLSVSSLPGEAEELSAYHAFQYPLKKEICQYYVTEEEQEYSLHNSNSRGSDLPSSDDYFTNTFDRAMGCPFLLDNSSWKESYLLDDDGFKQNCIEYPIP